MRLVDSVGWIEFLAKGPLSPAYRAYVLRPDEVITPVIVVYEVYKRVFRELGPEAASLAAAHMLATKVIDLDPILVISAAEVSVQHKLPMADAIIYATAQAEGAVLVTSDEHFKDLPGVEFVPRE